MMINKFIVHVILFLFLTSCDFSPRLHKEILKTQNILLEQKYYQAIASYEEILKEECPSEIKVKIFFQLGELYSTYLFNNKKAISYFRKVRKETSDPRWLYESEKRIAEINFSYLNNYEESMKGYKKLTLFIPKRKNNDFFEYRYAISLLRLDKYDKAANRFLEISKNKKHKYCVDALHQLGIVSFKKKQWKIAINYWNKYIKKEKRQDNIVRTKFLMANAYETIENLEKAYNIYYSILGEYPNTKVIKNRLNAIYERKIARRR